jgi:hypothetical protein
MDHWFCGRTWIYTVCNKEWTYSILMSYDVALAAAAADDDDEDDDGDDDDMTLGVTEFVDTHRRIVEW